VKASDTQIILRPLVTEKGVEAATRINTYQFEVAREANKAEIKAAVERIFKVKVRSVRTAMRRGKPRRVRFKRGHTRVWKKAVVRLVPGHTIEFI
jgi:large subunit ribosomal protein L23